MKKKYFPKSIIFVLVFIASHDLSFGQDFECGALSFAVGWTRQERLEQVLSDGSVYSVDNLTALSFDLLSYGLLEEVSSIGFGGGLTIRSFNFKDMQTDNENPYNIWKTHFDGHIGPMF